MKPTCFAEEMAGIRDGGKSIGIPDMDKLTQVSSNLFIYKTKPLKYSSQRFVTLGNMPGDYPSIEKLVEYETQKKGESCIPQFYYRKAVSFNTAGMPEWMKKLEDGVRDHEASSHNTKPRTII